MTLSRQLEVLFAPFRKDARSFPPPRSLGNSLRAIVRTAASDTESIPPRISALFASASVEMWLRAVHSFMISASLHRASNLWASVAGYYASHYAVRSFAHALGYFQLHADKRVIQLDVTGTHHVCNITKKDASHGEHRFYWRVVKRTPDFAGDPFFTFNPENEDVSDLAHRGLANYADHLNRFETFDPLDAIVLRGRIDHLSSVELSSVPIPDRTRYPDVDAVQLVAYHRIVKFRRLLDSALGGKNRFWNAHRSPTWAANLMDFQVVEPRFLAAYAVQT